MSCEHWNGCHRVSRFMLIAQSFRCTRNLNIDVRFLSLMLFATFQNVWPFEPRSLGRQSGFASKQFVMRDGLDHRNECPD